MLGALGLVLGIVGYHRYWRQNLRRFEVVRPGVLYRCGQPSERGMRYLVNRHGVRTILSLRRKQPPLRQRLFFRLGPARGATEADYAAELGIRHLWWPLGDEVYWPWLTPGQFDRFFELMDDPANLPVAVHCKEGRHRTGTYAALFRLEYDRWAVESALLEMHSFEFGPPQPIQEHNLRTYLPRPRPEVPQWDELVREFHETLPGGPPADYEQLVRRLRATRDRPAVQEGLERYVSERRPFGLCLAHRLIDAADDPLAATATRLATEYLSQTTGEATDWAVSAALVGDFGTSAQQERLLALLEEEVQGSRPTPRYRAVVAGVTNRYTPNRIAYLRPLLGDTRYRPERAAAKYRYADTAVARLTSILNEEFLEWDGEADRAAWDRAIRAALRWLADHPEASRPRQLDWRGALAAQTMNERL